MSSQFSSAASSSIAPRRLAIAAAAAGFGAFVNMWCTQPIVLVLASAFHVSLAAANNTVTAPLLATAIAAPLSGAISDRFGRKIFISGAAFLLVIPTIFAAMAGSIEILAACRFIQGLLLPFIFTVTIAYMADELPPATATRMAGTYLSGTILGGFSGRFISGMTTAFFGWHAAFAVIGLLSLSAALLVVFLLPQERQFRPVAGWGQTFSSFPVHLHNPKLLGNYAIGFCVLFCLVALFTFLNFRFAAAPFHFGPGTLGSIFAAYLGGVAISPVAGRLAATRGRIFVMRTAFLITAAGLALTLFAPLPLILLGLLLATCGIFAQQTVATGYTGTVARAAKSTAAGLYVTFYYIGGSCGGILPNPVWHMAGWAGCAAIIAMVQLIMLGLASWLYK